MTLSLVGSRVLAPGSPGLCPLLQFLLTRSLQEARGPACVFLPLHTPSLLSPSRAALVPLFFGENDIYDQVENSPESWLQWLQDQLHRAVEALFCSSMAVESSSTALVLCPTTDLSPLWLSLNPGMEVEGLQGKGPGLLL